MRQTKPLLSLVLSCILISSLSPQRAQALLCAPGSAFATGSSTLPPEAAWRSASAQANRGQYTATSARREQQMQASAKGMENFILNFKGQYGQGDTPPMEFFPAEGSAKVSFISRSNGLHGTLTRIQVSGLGASGTLEGTLLLPVSGHLGNDYARQWAVTDTYTIRSDLSRDAAGKDWGSYYNEGALTSVVPKRKSLALVTTQEVSIPLNSQHAVRIYYFRSGSSGPGGYEEGRIIEIFWDGT